MNLTRAQATEAAEIFGKVVRLNLDYEMVAGKQIIKALLQECNITFLRPSGAQGYLYKTIQNAANVARRKNLLFNPSPFARENKTYSAAVGNTGRMQPSRHGWEMTKGILSGCIGREHEKVLQRLKTK